MSGRRIAAITGRLLRQFRRDRRTLALLFLLPIVILSLMDFLLRGGGELPSIAVVNEDRGPLGAQVSAQLMSSGHVRAHAQPLAAARRELADGKVAGFVRFPEDFSDSALNRHLLNFEVDLEGTQPSLNQTVLGAVTQAVAAAAAGGGAGIRLDPKVAYLHGSATLDTLDYLGAGFIGLIVFFLVFVITSVSFLRERSQGTLERLMASPLRRGEIVLGYMLGFTILALLQGLEVLLFSLYVIHIYNSGSVLLIFGIEVLLALVAVNLGIFLSMFARTEFQAVQFIPLVVVPQILLSGILVPVSSEPGWLQYLSNVLPLTYAVHGLQSVMLQNAGLGSGLLQRDIGVVAGYCVALVVAASATLRRRIA